MAPWRHGLHGVRLPSNAFSVASANPRGVSFPFQNAKQSKNQVPITTTKKQYPSQGYAEVFLICNNKIAFKYILIHPSVMLSQYFMWISIIKITVITLFT